MSDQAERNPDGTFAKGHTKSGGRAPRQAEERLVRRLSARLNNGDFDKILDALIRQAQRGDVPAARLLLEYAVGKPAQPVDMQSNNIVRIIIQHERRNDNAA